MNFSLEITIKTELSSLPKVKDVYITQLPGNDFSEVACKAKELADLGFIRFLIFQLDQLKTSLN